MDPSPVTIHEFAEVVGKPLSEVEELFKSGTFAAHEQDGSLVADRTEIVGWMKRPGSSYRDWFEGGI